MEMVQAATGTLSSVASWLFVGFLREPLALTAPVSHVRGAGRALVAIVQCTCPTIAPVYRALSYPLFTNETDVAVSSAVNAVLGIAQVPINATIQTVWSMNPVRMNIDYPLDHARTALLAGAAVLNGQLRSIFFAVEALVSSGGAPLVPPPIFSPAARFGTVIVEAIRVPLTFMNSLDRAVRISNINTTYMTLRADRLFDEVSAALNETFISTLGATPFPSGAQTISYPFRNLGTAAYYGSLATSGAIRTLWQAFLAVPFGAVPGSAVILPADPFRGIAPCVRTFSFSFLRPIQGATPSGFMASFLAVPAGCAAYVDAPLRLFGDSIGRALGDFGLFGISNAAKFGAHSFASLVGTVTGQSAYYASFPLASGNLNVSCPSELAAQQILDATSFVEALPDVLSQFVDFETALGSKDAHHGCSKFTAPNYFFYALAAFYQAGDACNAEYASGMPVRCDMRNITSCPDFALPYGDTTSNPVCAFDEAAVGVARSLVEGAGQLQEVFAQTLVFALNCLSSLVPGSRAT